MSLFEALILGIVQGLTEFLPVSSSGHLVLFPFVVGWDIPSVGFDVAVHFGTLVGVAWVLRERIVLLARALVGWASAPEDDRRLWRLLAIGTLPIAVFGLVAKATVEDTFERPVLVSILLGVTGWVLLSVDTRTQEASPERGETELHDGDAATIGVAQAAAIFPGISRSGMTISAGMLRGMSRRAAAQFAFLLAIPAILGATVVKLFDLGEETGAGGGAIVLGMLAAVVSGAVAVRWFLGLIERRGLRPFAIYCFLAMTAGLIAALARG